MTQRFSTIAFATVVAVGLAASSLARADDTLAQGSFTGASGHETSGSVSVQKTDNGHVVVLGEDFSFDGAPDPKLGFGKGGYDSASKFSVLKSNSGRQVYELPAGIDPAQYDEIWVWCERYSVPLGVANLN